MVSGTGPVAGTKLIAEMPETGTITGKEAAALTGLAPVAHDRTLLTIANALCKTCPKWAATTA